MSEYDSDGSRGIVCKCVFSCMWVLICVLNFVLGSVLSNCGKLLYTVEYLKNSDVLSCFVFGLYSGFSGGLLRCGLCGILYIEYSDSGILVDCILCI